MEKFTQADQSVTLEMDGLLGFDQMTKAAAADISGAGRLLSKIGAPEAAPLIEVGDLLGFDQLPKVSSEADGADPAKTARLLTKIGPEIPTID
ncbi:MAG: hypothetical protein AB7O39_11720 [Flavobacteriaceae bacterium]